jgi:hypothetical protein
VEFLGEEALKASDKVCPLLRDECFFEMLNQFLILSHS